MIKFNKKEFEQFLINGNYYFSSDYKQLSLAKKQVIEHFNEDGLSLNFKILIKKIVTKLIFIKIKSENKKFNGNTILLPSTKYGFKVFSESKVLTYYYNAREKFKQLKFRKALNKIFQIPNITEETDNYIIEERIDNHFFKDEDALKYILDCYLEALQKKVLVINEKKLTKQRFYDNFKKFYNTILPSEKKYLCILQHGDMWHGNILNSKNNNFYVLDYEKYGDRYFLYDFFFYIYSNCLIYNDFSLLNKYFESYFDNSLEKIFKNLNLTFKTTKKLEYFYTFLNLYICDKFKSYDFKSFQKYLNLLININNYATIKFKECDNSEK